MKLNPDNFLDSVLVFSDRQAGISTIYDPESERFTYNAYCLEKKLLKELYSCEFEELDAALSLINEEFGSWEIKSLMKSSGCGSCAAK